MSTHDFFVIKHFPLLSYFLSVHIYLNFFDTELAEHREECTWWLLDQRFLLLTPLRNQWPTVLTRRCSFRTHTPPPPPPPPSQSSFSLAEGEREACLLLLLWPFSRRCCTSLWRQAYSLARTLEIASIGEVAFSYSRRGISLVMPNLTLDQFASVSSL